MASTSSYVLKNGNNAYASNGGALFTTGANITGPLLDLNPELWPYADGEPMPRLYDSSGYDRHCDQDIAAHQGLMRRTGGPNNKAYIYTDGLDDWYPIKNRQNRQHIMARTVFMVLATDNPVQIGGTVLNHSESPERQDLYPPPAYTKYGDGREGASAGWWWGGYYGSRVIWFPDRSRYLAESLSTLPDNSAYINTGPKISLLDAPRTTFFYLLTLDMATIWGYQVCNPWVDQLFTGALSEEMVGTPENGLHAQAKLARLIIYDYRMTTTDRNRKIKELMTLYAL